MGFTFKRDPNTGGSLRALRAVAGRKLADARFRGYAGHAGWAPGHLDAKIARGGWKVLPTTADDVFTRNPADLWNKPIRQQNLELVDAARSSVLDKRGLKD